jgi:hypothetical protein
MNDENVLVPRNGQVLSDADVAQYMADNGSTDEAEQEDDLTNRLQSLLNGDTTEEESEAVEPASPLDGFDAPDSKTLNLKLSDADKSELDSLDALLRKRYGLSREDFESVAAKAREVEAANEVTTLQRSWGVDAAEYETRMTAVRAAFQKLPEAMQDALDNPQGAQMIWAMVSQGAPTKASVPTVEKSSGAKTQSSGKTHMFTQSEINRMSDADYTKNIKAIEQAYALGLVAD